MEEALEKLKRNEVLMKTSLPTLESTTEVNNVDNFLVSFSHDVIFVGSLEVPILGISLRLLTNMGYAEGECSKLAKASKELLKP